MKNTLIKLLIVTFVTSMPVVFAEGNESINAKVNKDIETFQSFFKGRYPKVEFGDFANGVYALDAPSREQWVEIEEFAPYELAIDKGATLYATAFANGKGYGNCFADDAAKLYPHFDVKRGEVITLELAINECRTNNGEKALGSKKGDIAAISAYMAYQVRGHTIDVDIPNQDAYDAYMGGKKFFYSKRGQLNFSCADCHMSLLGQRLRADLTSPALGSNTGFPVYRSKWNSMGTLHRRYGGCNKNVRAKPFKAQSTEYRQLEYFSAIMNKGLKMNGPSARK